MNISLRFSVAALAAALGMADDLRAQALEDVQTSNTPLALKAQGSFFVGGEKVEQTKAELGNLGPGGHITINQMYVRYMVPQAGDGNAPVVMVHGATLTGKTWETTPDGRMGWDEYFVRKGRPVYLPDQVGRGRSGFNQAIYNNVRAGSVAPASQPEVFRFSDENVWSNFRFGTKVGDAFKDSQFPLAAVDELSKQAVPDLNRGLPTPTPTIKALSDLATQLKGAVLIGHSQSGSFPLAAALLNPKVTKALVLLEPGTCPASYTDEQIKTLAAVPLLVVFGDHRNNPTGLATLPTWQARFEECQKLIGRLTAAGGHAQMLDPSERGIRGNSHMIMQDKNSLQIADLVLQWLDERVGKQSAVVAGGPVEAPPRRSVAPKNMQAIAPALADYTDRVLFGDVWLRPDLTPRDRSLVTVSALIATGKTQQLTGHLNRALDNGVQPTEISGVVTHLAFYTGWPNAVSALNVVEEVFAKRKVDVAALQQPQNAPIPAAGSETNQITNQNSATDAAAEQLTVIERGKQERTAPANNFTGRVTVASPFKGTGDSRLGGATVTFQPGARTHWHSHPVGQLLVVTKGEGWVQAEGEAVRAVKAGDVVWTAAGVKHWHGATSTSAMTHTAVAEAVEGEAVAWLEPVSGSQYRAP